MGFLDRILRKIRAERKYQEALAFQRAGSYREAAAAYREVIRLDPSFYKAYNNLGSVLLKNLKYTDPDCDTRFSEAVECYNKALEINPYDAITLYNLGTMYYDNFDDEEKAFELFARAINADPPSVPKIQQYLSWASYHPQEDFRKIVDRSIRPAAQNTLAYPQRPIISGISDLLKIAGSILLLVFIASFFVLPVCGYIGSKDNLVGTILSVVAIIGGLIGVVNAKSQADRMFNVLLCLLFVVMYYRVVLGCYHP
jgi:tetratricopeptide (TPR) repeat protein